MSTCQDAFVHSYLTTVVGSGCAVMAGGVACEAKAAAKRAGRNKEVVISLDTQRQAYKDKKCYWFLKEGYMLS